MSFELSFWAYTCTTIIGEVYESTNKFFSMALALIGQTGMRRPSSASEETNAINISRKVLSGTQARVTIFSARKKPIPSRPFGQQQGKSEQCFQAWPKTPVLRLGASCSETSPTRLGVCGGTVGASSAPAPSLVVLSRPSRLLLPLSTSGAKFSPFR